MCEKEWRGGEEERKQAEVTQEDSNDESSVAGRPCLGPCRREPRGRRRALLSVRELGQLSKANAWNDSH